MGVIWAGWNNRQPGKSDPNDPQAPDEMFLRPGYGRATIALSRSGSIRALQ
jgi:hypothetical protein